MMKKTLALIVALLMVLSLVACGGNKPTSTPATPSNPTQSSKPAEPSKSSEPEKPSEPSKPAEPEKPAEPKILHLTSSAAAGNALSLISQSDADMEIQGLIQGKLYGYLPIDGKAALVGVLADGEPVNVNGDGITWNIKMNPNAKWENGEPINADTVIFSFKAALDPKLLLKSGSGIASDYVTIINGTEYYLQNGEGKAPVAWEDVGIKKIDEQTIQITLTAQSTAFKVMRQMTKLPMLYQPLWEKCLGTDGTTTTYATSQDKIISSGPFKLTNWVIGSVREFTKNEYWTCADYIKLDGITYQVVEDSNTRVLMYEKGEVDFTSMTIDAAKQYADDPRLLTWQNTYTHVIDFCSTHTEKTFLANENFRLAIYYGLDRNTVSKINSGTTAVGLISPTSVAYSDGTTFRQLAAQAGYEPANGGYDPVKAVAYFEKALQECNLDKIEVTLLAHSTSALHSASAEFMQESLAELFGKDRFKMNLDMQPSSTALTQKKSWETNPNAYEMCITSWALSADDYDPILGMSPYTTSRAGRCAPYGFADLEEIWAKQFLPENTLNEKNRADLAMEFEKAVIEHAYAVPVGYGRAQGMVSDRVILAVNEYSADLGWGWKFCDIAQ